MATWDVTVEGTPVDALIEVKPEDKSEGQLARTKVTCGNTASNRAIASGDAATVTKNGSVEFEGNVTKKPSKGSNNDFLELIVGDKRVELHYEEVHRPFYNMDTGDIIAEAVNKRAQTLSRRTVTGGDESGSEWESDIPVFEPASFSNKRYRERGSDVVFCGWREGAAGEHYARFTDVPASAIPGDGQIMRLSTRALANNSGDQIRGEVELVDNADNAYVWDLSRMTTDFQKYELRAEDARTNAKIGSNASGTGVLEYRFNLTGELSEARAVLIDYAETLPFSLKTRNTAVSPAEVQTTGRTITRRYDASIMEMLKELSTEDGFTSYVDQSEDLHYEPAGQSVASKSIDHSSTPVVDADIDRDYDRITNKLTVQGSGGIQVTVQDKASVEFYGLSAREDNIVDKEIQTEREAQARGEAVLDDEAWHDTAMTFSVADASYTDVRVGQSMSVEWPPEDISGEYIVSATEVQDSGIVKVSLSGNTEA